MRKSSYHIVVLKRQLNHLKVGTDKPELKVKMRSVSDDDEKRERKCIAVNGIPSHSYGVSLAIWKRLLGKPRFELAAKGVFRLRCYILRTAGLKLVMIRLIPRGHPDNIN